LTELIASVGPVATGNAYASALTFKVPGQTGKMMVHAKEQNVNAIKWMILGSIDNANWSEEMAEASIGKNGFGVHEITKAWLYVDVQVKSAVAETAGSVSVAVSGGA